MFYIDEKIDDLVECVLNIQTLGYNRLLTIHFDADTNTLVYIFTNSRKRFVKFSLEAKDINTSISSFFKIADFFEEKLSNLDKLFFKKDILADSNRNHSFSKNGINIECFADNGFVSNSLLHWNQKPRSERFISLDGLLNSLSLLNDNEYTYQIMALEAVEIGFKVSKESASARMILIELDRLKYLFNVLDSYIESSKLEEVNLTSTYILFLDNCIGKKNLLSRDSELFKSNFKTDYKIFKKNILKILKILNKSYFNKILNKLQLKNTQHPLACSRSGVNGTLLRSSGVLDNYNINNMILYYNEFNSVKPSLDSSNSLHSFYIQVLSEAHEAISLIDTILSSDVLLSEAYDDFSQYDVNRFNSDSCFEIEGAHGLSSIYIFKDAQNKMGYQLNTESLKRLYYYLENIENIMIDDQINVLEALDIKLQEIF